MKETGLDKLKQQAKDVCRKAYAPYSKFSVGAALLTAEGEIYTGCNVENASFGLTTCAERNAIAAMVSHGQKSIETIVIYTPTKHPVEACGACRQVINEFSHDVKMISICDGEEVIETTITALLPKAFSGRKSLLGENN